MVQATEALRPVSGFKESFVDADGFNIRYLESGSGDALVAIHGGAGLQLTYAHELLAKQFRVIAFEMPGFGGSQNDRSKSVEDLAATMGQAAANLELDSYNLIGHSMGGKVAMWMALQFPERISCLVLVAPGVIVPETTGSAARLSSLSPEEILALTMAHPERRPAGYGIDPAVAASQRAFLQRVNAIARDEDLIGRVGEVGTPTLALFGTADGLISPDLGREYRARMPNCSLAFVYDAAHEILVDRPEALAGIVSDFLERHEVFVVGRRSGLINP